MSLVIGSFPCLVTIPFSDSRISAVNLLFGSTIRQYKRILPWTPFELIKQLGCERVAGSCSYVVLCCYALCSLLVLSTVVIDKKEAGVVGKKMTWLAIAMGMEHTCDSLWETYSTPNNSKWNRVSTSWTKTTSSYKQTKHCLNEQTYFTNSSHQVGVCV